MSSTTNASTLCQTESLESKQWGPKPKLLNAWVKEKTIFEVKRFGFDLKKTLTN